MCSGSCNIEAYLIIPRNEILLCKPLMFQDIRCRISVFIILLAFGFRLAATTYIFTSKNHLCLLQIMEKALII